jgi:IS1 family transposase
MNDDALVFSAKDGLGNRLRALVGFRALADFQQVPMLLHWPRDGACDADFTDLFDLAGWEDVRLIDADEAAARKASHPGQFHYSSVWFTEIWRQHGQAFCTQQEFSRVAVKYLRALRPRLELRARIDTFARAHELEHCIGMHIRMTDNVHAYDWWIRNDPDFVVEKVSRIEGFQAAIRNFSAQGKQVFVCTDNEEIAQQLAASLPNLILYRKEFDQQGFERHVRKHYGTQDWLAQLLGRIKQALGIRQSESWRTTNVTDALVEMLLLARCQRVIGTYYSSFSQVAALLGSIRLDRMEGVNAVESEFIHSLLADVESIDQT